MFGEGDFTLYRESADVYFWREEDGLVVLDYKTDKVYKIEELAEKYLRSARLLWQALEIDY